MKSSSIWKWQLPTSSDNANQTTAVAATCPSSKPNISQSTKKTQKVSNVQKFHYTDWFIGILMMAYYNPQKPAWKTTVAMLISINLNPLKTAILSLPKKRVLSSLVGGWTNPSEKYEWNWIISPGIYHLAKWFIIFHHPRFPWTSHGFPLLNQHFGGEEPVWGRDEIWLDTIRGACRNMKSQWFLQFFIGTLGICFFSTSWQPLGPLLKVKLLVG